LYYLFWIELLPRWGKYKIRTETLVSDQDGSVSHKLTKVKNTEVEEWDRTHDGAGNLMIDASAAGEVSHEHLVRRVKVRDVTTVDYEAGGKA
jgi:hypothetical protein